MLKLISVHSMRAECYSTFYRTSGYVFAKVGKAAAAAVGGSLLLIQVRKMGKYQNNYVTP